RRRQKHRGLFGLGIDAYDVAGGEIEQIKIVLRIRMDAVGADTLAGARVLRRAEILEFAGGEIEPIDVAAGGVLDPYGVIGGRTFDREMTELAGVGVPLFRRRPGFEFLCLAV